MRHLTVIGQIEPNELIDTSGVGWEELLGALIAIVVAVVLSRLVKAAVTRALRTLPNLQTGLARFVGRAAGWFIVVLGVVVALVLLGFSAGPLFLLLLIVGAIVFVSGRPVLENFGSSFVLQARSPFKLGDEIELAGFTGVVVDIDSRVTLVETLDGRRVFIPNSTVLANPIVNHTTLGYRRSTVEIGVEYGTDLDEAIAVVRRVLSETSSVLAEPEPQVQVSEFADSSIVLLVWLWHAPRTVEGIAVTDTVLRGITAAFAERGIVIAFPQRVIWHRQEGADTPEQ